MENEMISQPDCLEIFDEGDDYPDSFLCTKWHYWLDEIGVCFECKGQWSEKQIADYEEKEWRKNHG